MKIFFDVDGVLIDGWHADASRRKPWDATIEADLGIDRETFQHLFFGTVGARSFSRMVECVSGRSDLKSASIHASSIYWAILCRFSVRCYSALIYA